METQVIDNNIVKPEKQKLVIPRQDWMVALVFLLSMSMTGLQFPLGYLLLAVILINRFIKDRYDFLIQITLFFGGYALIGEEDFPVKPEDIALGISVIGMMIYKKSPLLRKIMVAMLLYALALVLIAKTSDEAMSVQVRRMRTYLMIFYVFVPLLVFSGRSFDIRYFFKKLFPYTLVICCFYIIDGYILGGYVLLPNTHIWNSDAISSFNNLICAPLSGYFPRKYPPGLYLMSLCLFPVMKYYRLNWRYWVLILLAFSASRTLTVIGGLLIAYGIFQGHIKKMLKYSLFAVIAVSLVYFVDKSTGGFLRVQSTIDQFTSLEVAQDDEDLSEFASGRIGQTIPKFEVLYSLDREWLGFGFLHPELTKNPKYWIDNEFYSDISRSEEVVTGVEIAPLQVILDVGYIGLIIHLALFIYIYILIRRLRYSMFYLSTLVVNFIFGLGGFAGLHQPHGELLVALSLAAVFLANKNRDNKLSEAFEVNNGKKE